MDKEMTLFLRYLLLMLTLIASTNPLPTICLNRNGLSGEDSQYEGDS